MMQGNEPIETKENSPKKVEDFLRVARKRAARAITYWNENFDVAKKDLEFLYGVGHWDAEAEKERTGEGRPCLVINQLPQYKRQIVNEMRRSTPRINVVPVNADMKPEGDGVQNIRIQNIKGTKDYSMAEVFEGLIRNIENVSLADGHYDRAGQHGVESGFGWLRVLTHYQNKDTFDQEAKITSVVNRFSVLCDPDYKEPDTTDKNWIFLSEKIHKDEFQTRYPDAVIGDIAAYANDDEIDWCRS